MSHDLLSPIHVLVGIIVLIAAVGGFIGYRLLRK